MNRPSNDIDARVFRSPLELRAIVEDWRKLFRTCPEATPFQSPDWLLHWIEVFSPKNLIAIEFRDCGRLVGLAPLLIYARGSEKVLAFAGGGVSDYLNFICAPGYETAVIHNLVDVITSEPGWDTLDLTDLSAASSLVSTTTDNVREHDACTVLTLPDSQDELLHLFSKRQRANLRNARSRLQRAGGGQVELATSNTQPEFLDDLFRLHTDRWNRQGEDGVLSDERTRDFHRRSAPDLLSEGILRLYRLRVNNQTAAVLYTLFHRETVFCYMQGYDPELSALGPGTQLMFAIMEEAVRLRMRRFDFLRGDEAYKLHWRPTSERTYRLEIPRSSVNQLLTFHSQAA